MVTSPHHDLDKTPSRNRPTMGDTIRSRCLRISIPIISAWYKMAASSNIWISLVGGLEHDLYFSIQLGMSSSQLTHIFQGGWNLNQQPEIPSFFIPRKWIHPHVISMRELRKPMAGGYPPKVKEMPEHLQDMASFNPMMWFLLVENDQKQQRVHFFCGLAKIDHEFLDGVGLIS